jgi:hypothetical protein
VGRAQQRMIVAEETGRHLVEHHGQGAGSLLEHPHPPRLAQRREQILGHELFRPEEIEVTGAAMPEAQSERGAA